VSCNILYLTFQVHRRLLNDDAFGVGEALNEIAYGKGLVVRGQHYVVSGNSDDLDETLLQEKKLASELTVRPWTFISPVNESFEEWNEYYKMKVG
jgi:lysosomal alpha-mannosidase